MQHFFESVIKPQILEKGYRRICEIGAALGGNTDMLLTVKRTEISIIDAFLDCNLQEKYMRNRRVKVHKGLSLQILPNLNESFDCILIDADHNWYTVFNELSCIERQRMLRKEGTIFLHDTSWPYGRRDMYYDPTVIPPKYLHPFERSGIVKGQIVLTHNASGTNANLMNALCEGGPRNGVLTAIEDFLKIRSNEYVFLRIEEENGLGILVKTDGANVTLRKRLSNFFHR
jgi:hypothetical protein